MDNSIENKESWTLLAENSKHMSNDVYKQLVIYSNNTYKCENKVIAYLDPVLLSQQINIKEYLNFPEFKDINKNKHAKKEKKSETIIKKNCLQEAHKFIKYLIEYPYGTALKTNYAELIAFIYVYRIIISKHNQCDWIDAIISLRDCCIAYENILNNVWLKSLKNFLDNNYSDKSIKLCLKYSYLLLKSDFKTNYDKSIVLYSEQKKIIDLIKTNNGSGLYTLGWGVGCGKTEMVPAICTIAYSFNSYLIYAVSTGPIRNQMASLLLKCGVPFAFVTYNQKIKQYQIQPSYACKNGIFPKIYITSFNYAKLIISGIIPNLFYPDKSYYKHINENNIWDSKIWYIIDEPDPDDINIQYIINHLPETIFIMSATCYHIIDDSIINKYKEKYKNHYTSLTDEIGVSASIYSWWTDNPIMITPWHGCNNISQFKNRNNQINKSTMLKRYISPPVVTKLLLLLKIKLHDIIKISLFNISYKLISDIGIQIAEYIIKHKDDNWIFENFKLAESTNNFNINQIIKNAHLFSGGTLIGINDINNTYNLLKNEITLPDIETMNNDLINKKNSILYEIQKHNKALKTNDDIPFVIQQIDRLPINEKLIINSYQYCQDHKYIINQYTLPNIPRITGSIDQPETYHVNVDTTQGIPNIKEEFKTIGITNIDDNNIFTIKNINNLYNNQVAYILSNELGAFGLNMPISNCIIVDIHRKDILRQLCGRVGRASQKDYGNIYLTSINMFDSLIN